MTTTFAQATTARDAATIRTANLALAASLGANVSGFDDTSPQRVIFETDARALAAEESTRVQLANAGFITTAALAGDDFFDEALTWFDLVRIPASKAVWTLPVSCVAGAGPYPLTTASGELVAQADDGTYFESTPVSATSIPSGGTKLIRFTAMSPGTKGNQNPGSITHLTVGRPGLSVTNAAVSLPDIAARDAETSAEATKRAIGRWATIGVGWTRDTFDYLVPTFAPTVTKWFIRDDNPKGPGTIEVVMANAAGPSSPAENAAVLAGLSARGTRTVGTGALYVTSAVAGLITIAGAVFSDGTNSNLLADAKAALDALRVALPLGGDETGAVRVALLVEVLMGGAVKKYGLPGFSGARNVVLSSPPGDWFSLTNVITFDHTGLYLL